jgi:NAD(P)-dependent dehydrogenase (short-subunit alcohol dehydrogenase family)
VDGNEETLLRSSYSDSKLHDVMLAKVFARRWIDVSSFSADPGWVPTKMGGRSAPGNIEHAVDTFVMRTDDYRLGGRIPNPDKFSNLSLKCLYQSPDKCVQRRKMCESKSRRDWHTLNPRP